MTESKIVQRWFSFAADDLKVSKYCLEFNLKNKAISAFLSQQCAEKAIKGFLAANNVRFKKIHNLKELAKDVATIDRKLSKLIMQCRRLSDFAVAYRYPDAERRPLTLKRARGAIKQAEKIYNECLTRIA